MLMRQSSSRSHRSKKPRASHSFQAVLLVAVAIWIVYQLTHSFGERRRPVAVETGGSGNDDAEPARRRLGRKGFVRFPGHASVDGVRSWSGDGSSDDDPLSVSKAGDGDGDEEDREADEDDAADADVDDADQGLAVAAGEEDDGAEFQSQDGSREDDPRAVPVHGGTQDGLNISVVATVNGTGTVLDGAAVLLPNAAGGAAHGTAPTLRGSAKNTSSVGMSLLRGTRSAGDVGSKLLASSSAVGAARAENATGNSN